MLAPCLGRQAVPCVYQKLIVLAVTSPSATGALTPHSRTSAAASSLNVQLPSISLASTFSSLSSGPAAAQTVSFMSKRSWKLGYELLEFGLRPSSGGASAHVALRSKGKSELCDVVPVGSVQEDKEIVFAGR